MLFGTTAPRDRQIAVEALSLEQRAQYEACIGQTRMVTADEVSDLVYQMNIQYFDESIYLDDDLSHSGFSSKWLDDGVTPADALPQRHQLDYFEVSALDDDDVGAIDQVFVTMAQQVFNTMRQSLPPKGSEYSQSLYN